MSSAIELVRPFGPPQLTWLVTALLVQRERQRWHHEVTRGHHDANDKTLRGHPGWTARHHGIGIRLTAPDGEELDVDFNDDTGAVIDTWFFAYRIASLQSSPNWLAERRLWRWRPMIELIVDGIEELVALGAVTYIGEYTNQIVLSSELEACARAVTDELASRETWDRWLDVLEPDGEPAHVAQHREWMRKRVQTSSRPGPLLALALRDASPTEVETLCAPLLQRIDGNAGDAIQLLRERRDVPVLPEVVALLRRASLDSDHPFAPSQACAYLIERDVERDFALERFDAWSGLEQAAGYGGNPMSGDMTIFALQHLPDRALGLVRTCLRSPVPLSVGTIATLLAAIDQPWCRRELATALSPEADRELFEELSDGYVDEELREVANQLRWKYPPDWDG